MSAWFEETLHDGVGQRLSMDRVLHHEKSDQQELVIFENRLLGRVLALDGVVQTTERDEFVYHEMISHVPMVAHSGPKQVLIIGGGDGGVARHVVMHAVDKVTMVEIDPAVIETAKTYLPSISAGAFDNPKLDLIIDDGFKFVHETEEKFDVVIVDSTDPVGPGKVLFTREFYAGCKRVLNDGGILVTQNGVPFLQPQEVTDTHGELTPIFADVRFYVAPVPLYHGGHMAFGWASDTPDLGALPLDVLKARFKASGVKARYYTPALHAGAFALPQFVLDLCR